MLYKIEKEHMKNYIDWLLKKYEVWGPRLVGSDYVFSRLDNGSQFKDVKTLLGPKEQIYPPIENIFKDDSKELIVIGVKSCDLRAFKMLDDVFLKEYKDNNFENRRSKVHFFNFVCTEPCEYGFCTTFYGPRLEEGFELQFTDIGSYYLVESFNDRFIGPDTEIADERDLETAKNMAGNVYDKMKRYNVENMAEKLDWNSPLWKEYGERCISCGACNYACPTCFCFDVFDVDNERFREWDSCILAGFTRIAGNANPRITLDLRLRQRFLHKLKFHYENYGYYLCTGCGRCIEVCPVKIDIREVIEKVKP